MVQKRKRISGVHRQGSEVKIPTALQTNRGYPYKRRHKADNARRNPSLLRQPQPNNRVQDKHRENHLQFPQTRSAGDEVQDSQRWRSALAEKRQSDDKTLKKWRVEVPTSWQRQNQSTLLINILLPMCYVLLVNSLIAPSSFFFPNFLLVSYVLSYHSYEHFENITTYIIKCLI